MPRLIHPDPADPDPLGPLFATLGAALRAYRISLGWQRATLLRMAGINSGKLYRTEQGRGNLRNLVSTATRLGLTVELRLVDRTGQTVGEGCVEPDGTQVVGPVGPVGAAQAGR